jgi:hypothetical protein
VTFYSQRDRVVVARRDLGNFFIAEQPHIDRQRLWRVLNFLTVDRVFKGVEHAVGFLLGWLNAFKPVH